MLSLVLAAALLHASWNALVKAGGDPFDLKDVGLKSIRFVRITDLDNSFGAEGTTGFDLDAVAAVHSRPRKKDKE